MDKVEPKFDIEPVADELVNRGVLASIMNHVAYDVEHGAGTYRTLVIKAFDSPDCDEYGLYSKELQKSEEIRYQLCLHKKETLEEFLDKYKDVTEPTIREYINMVQDYYDGRLKRFINK